MIEAQEVKKKCIEKHLRQATLQYLELKAPHLPQFEERERAKPEIPNLRAITPTLQLSTQFKGSEFHRSTFRQLATKYPYYTKIRGDGNCYYRAVLIQYFEHLILDENAPQLLLDFIRMLVDQDGWAYWKHNHLHPDYNEVVGYLSQLYQIREKQGASACLTLFYKMMYWNQQFDLLMVNLLRQMVAQFLLYNKDLSINGLGCDFIYDTKVYSSLQEYVHKNVLSMGTQASDLALYVLPCILRINIITLLIDKTAGNGINQNPYNCVLDGKRCDPLEDALCFENKSITLLLKPGHYDALYSKTQVQAFQRMCKKFPPDQSFLPSPTQFEPGRTVVAAPFKSMKPDLRKNVPKDDLPQAALPPSVKIPFEMKTSCGCLVRVEELKNHFVQGQEFYGILEKKEDFIRLDAQSNVIMKPKCCKCKQDVSYQTLHEFSKYYQITIPSRKGYKERVQKCQEEARSYVLSPCCNERLLVNKLKADIENYFVGTKPEAFFRINPQSKTCITAAQIKEWPMCLRCKQPHHHLLFQLYPNQFRNEELEVAYARYTQHRNPQCWGCKKEASAQVKMVKMQKDYFCCEQCYHHICDHYKRHDALLYFTKYKKFKFEQLEDFIVFSKKESRKERPFCQKCNAYLDPMALTKLCDFKFSAAQIELAIYRWDRQQLPHCYLCSKFAYQTPSKQELNKKQNSKNMWVHVSCEITKVQLVRCRHIFQAQELDLQLNKFEHKLRKTLKEERCFVNELAYPSQIEFPQCLQCHLALDGEDIQRIRPDEIKAYQYNKKVMKYLNWNLNICELCNQEIGLDGASGTARHKECIQKRIKLARCGCVFIKDSFLEMMDIKKGKQFEISQLFIVDQIEKRVIRKVCPGMLGQNCGKKIEIRDIEDLTQNVDIESQKIKLWSNYNFSLCSLCEKEIGIQEPKQIGQHQLAHYQCASKLVKLNCGHILLKETLKDAFKEQGLGYESPEQLFVIKVDCKDAIIIEQLKLMPECPNCETQLSFQSIVNLLDLDYIKRRQFADQFKKVRQYTMPVCSLCEKRKKNQNLRQLDDGKFYHLDTCALKNILMPCCNKILLKRLYFQKYPWQTEKGKVHRFFKLEGRLIFKIGDNYTRPSCLQCKQFLTWQGIQQLLIKPDFIPGQLQKIQFDKWIKRSEQFRKCFLCNAFDKSENLVPFTLSGKIKGYGHRNELTEEVGHECSFQFKRYEWIKAIYTQFGDVLENYSNFFKINKQEIHRPYCPNCQKYLKLNQLEKIFVNRFDKDKFNKIRTRILILTKEQRYKEFKYKIESEEKKKDEV